MNLDERTYELVEQSIKDTDEQIRAELPPDIYAEIVEQTEWIMLPDGVRLFARIIKPDREGKWPVVLIRTPYWSTDISESRLTASALARHGYAVVVNQVRGSLSSEGEWSPFEKERTDGRAVIDWIASQDWCDGNIGTMGGSYMGHVQWSVADYHHPMLKTMFISVYGPSPYDLFYRRGMFREDIFTGWAATMMGENRHHGYHPEDEAVLRKKAYQTMPRRELGENLIGRPCVWYRKWIENTKESDPYWSEGFWKELEESIGQIQIPLFLHGGWFDIFLRAQLKAFRRLPENVREKSCFMIGPWCHNTKPGGILNYPDENRAGTLYVKAALEWFDHQLKGKENKHPLGTVEAYHIGEGRWHHWKGDIHADKIWKCFLDSRPLLEGNSEAGLLGWTCPEKEKKVCYSYDPRHPVQSKGGSLLFNLEHPMDSPECSTEQPSPGAREDVVSFISDTLSEEKLIAGSIQAYLYVSSDVPATSFTVKVMEIFEDGLCVNIGDDITDIRWREEDRIEVYEAGSVVRLHIELTDIVWRLRQGSRLRVDISSSNFPAYHVHPNVETIWSDTDEKRAAIQNIYTGGKYPSRVEVPVLDIV